MSVRLPVPGEDNGQWGNLLNQFLSVEHNSDGTLKKAGDITGAVASAQQALAAALQDNTVNGVTVSGTAANGKVITASSNTTATWSTPSGGSSPYILAGSDAPVAIKSLATATADGTATGDTAALSAALAQAGVRPIEIYGSFILNTALTVSATDYVTISGHNATIYTADTGSAGVAITGSRADLGITFSATLTQGTNVISYSSLTTVPAVGQWLGLTGADNTTGEPWGSRPGENFYGEWLQVESVDTNLQTITVKYPFRETYHVTTSSYKLFGYSLIKRPRVSGLRIIGPGGTGNPVTTGTTRNRPFVITYAEGALFEDCYVEAPYGREGIAVYECLHARFLRCATKDVNDVIAVTSGGSYEGYGIRVMGCEGATVEDCTGSGSRHVVEVNGGQNGYGLSGALRPISYNTLMRRIIAHKSWSAGVGDHPGSVGTVFEDITTIGCSGGIFTRGKRARIIGSLTVLGGHHLPGPYSSNQGNDHAITVGEQQRDTASANNNTTRGGWCGTNLVIDVAMNFDMTGNGTTLASTAHAVHVVHPLDNATIKLKGIIKPSGNGVNMIGDYARDSVIELSGIDMSSAFSTNGYFVNLAPLATSPTLSTGQYVSGMRIDVIGLKPRTGGIYIAGNAANDANISDSNEIRLRSRLLGNGLSVTSPLITLGPSPNATTGYHGFVRLRDLVLKDVNFATAVATTTTSIVGIGWLGISRFANGARIDGVPFLSTGQVRIPVTSGLATVTPTTGDKNVLYIWKVRACGQAMSAANIAVTSLGSGDGVGMALRVGAYADDGTGNAPALNTNPLLDSGAISWSATGNTTVAVSYTEPIGEYWVGVVLQYTTAPTTFPTFASLANPVLMAPVGLISTGTTINQARVWKATAVAGTLGQLTTITQDQSAHIVGALQV
jgi:hypothetical protein